MRKKYTRLWRKQDRRDGYCILGSWAYIFLNFLISDYPFKQEFATHIKFWIQASRLGHSNLFLSTIVKGFVCMIRIRLALDYISLQKMAEMQYGRNCIWFNAHPGKWLKHVGLLIVILGHNFNKLDAYIHDMKYSKNMVPWMMMWFLFSYMFAQFVMSFQIGHSRSWNE